LCQLRDSVKRWIVDLVPHAVLQIKKSAHANVYAILLQRASNPGSLSLGRPHPDEFIDMI
jgi:hypothetical protein